MKALITGGAGFIGSHIARSLCNQGGKVVVLDSLESNSPPNLAWRQGGHDLEWVQGNIANGALVKRLIQGCDWVFHHAAIASVPDSIDRPLETNQNNLTGSLELLVAARDANVKRFVFASSSAIYGNHESPTKHEDLPPDPISPYALQKYASEKYGQMFHQLFGLETISLRYFNVFGPRQAFDSPYSGVIARFCTQMLNHEEPVVFGDGLQSRDFVYVENVVHANLLAASAQTDKVAGKVFNIGSGKSTTLLDLIGELNQLTGQKLSPRFETARPGDVRTSQADITKARQDLGFEPITTWQIGLKETLDFYRNQK